MGYLLDDSNQQQLASTGGSRSAWKLIFKLFLEIYVCRWRHIASGDETSLPVPGLFKIYSRVDLKHWYLQWGEGGGREIWGSAEKLSLCRRDSVKMKFPPPHSPDLKKSNVNRIPQIHYINLYICAYWGWYIKYISF